MPVATAVLTASLVLSGTPGSAARDAGPIFLPDPSIPTREEPPPSPPPDQGSSGAPQQPAPESKPKPRPRTRTVRLSNEWTNSRWAYVLRSTSAKRSPSSRAKTVKRLRTETSDGTPELVLTLKQTTFSNGSSWVLVRLPMRPNGRTGWVPRRALGRFYRVVTALRISRRGFRATFYRRGRRIWSARIGVGKRKWPTPAGRYYVRERLIPARKNGVYGVFAFGTSAYSPVLDDWPGGGVIGIHGTNQPHLIPGRISHGCIRVRNSAISRLRKLMGLGTPIKIS